jgi:hypothetical protein
MTCKHHFGAVFPERQAINVNVLSLLDHLLEALAFRRLVMI